MAHFWRKIMQRTRFLPVMRVTLLIAAAATLAPLACAEVETSVDADEGQSRLATGQLITPLAPAGAIVQPLNPGLAGYPNFVAGEAVRSQLSPDGTTLAILCAGQNSLYPPDGIAVDAADSTQYIFLYDVAGANAGHPKLTQVIKQPNSHVGLAWAPDGNALYAAGGNDDAVYVYTRSGAGLAAAGTIALGHSGTHANAGIGLGVEPNASGLAVSADGATLVVANNYNDSISVVDTGTRTVRYEHDLRPFFARNEGTSGAAGGTFPFAVAVKGSSTAYVSSDRDREVVVVDISSPTAGHLVKRIKLNGNALGMTLNKAQTRLYVAQDNADEVAVIDTASNRVIDRIDARAPAGMLPGPQYTGAATFAVTVSPDEKTLYAVNSGANSIAVIPLAGIGGSEGEDGGLDRRVAGLIPTAYDPHDITFSADGAWMYIVNGKSVTGPNPHYRFGNTALLTTVTYPGGNAAAAAAGRASNQYQFQLERATLVSAPVPGSEELAGLTRRVAMNNGYSVPPRASDRQVIEFLRDRIQHIIYVVKENRTFDQILGDLTNGANVDASLNLFGQAITPNFHRLATNFVTLDNFMDPGDGSMDGWSWAMAGRVTNTETITQQINYARVDRGLSYESEGSNRNVPVGLATVAARDAATNGGFSAGAASLPGGPANLLAGIGNHAATDASFGMQQGYIFDAILQAGKTVRNYGFMVNSIGSIGTRTAPVSDPYAAGIVQVAPLNPKLLNLTDLYFRGYDQNYPDVWRYNEWKREFDQFVENGNLPNLTLFRVSHDHTGSFGSALAGVDTPETQQADDDLSVGRLVEAVAHSPYAGNTLIFITEDDCQDGPDHVDSHRATAYVVGPYVRQNAVVSTRYSQVSVLRTIEDILDAPHINLNTAYERPMADVFDISSSGAWTYTSVASTILATTTLSAADIGPRYAAGPMITPKHDAAYWDRVTRGFDFSDADRVPPAVYNKVLWTGLMEDKPYPSVRSAYKTRAVDPD
jgi:YVTN family beta-propeller protein